MIGTRPAVDGAEQLLTATQKGHDSRAVIADETVDPHERLAEHHAGDITGDDIVYFDDDVVFRRISKYDDDVVF